MSELIALSLGANIKLDITFAPLPLHAEIDPGQLESALLNICINCGHAITDLGHVWIDVKQSPNGVSVIIKDDGCGMNSQVLGRVFEPFYSTRRSSEGSGLGLSMVFGFIKQSGGEISISSEQYVGTTVILTVPMVLQHENQNVLPNTAEPKRTILLVDDDAVLLRKTNEMLSALGHSVLTAGSFTRAQEFINESTHFDLLFTDINLEDGHSGWTLAQQCLDLANPPHVLVTSGTFTPSTQAPSSYTDKVTMICKPYSQADLRAAVNMQQNV